MKQIAVNLKKCLCLMLGIFLLTSNVQVFAQEADFLAPATTGMIAGENKIFGNTLERFKSGINKREYTVYTIFHELLDYYENLIKEEDLILAYTRSIDVADKTAIEIIAYSKYLATESYEALKVIRLEDQIVFKKLEALISLAFTEKEVVDFENCLKYFENRFGKDKIYESLKKDVIIYNKEIYPKMAEFFRKAVKPSEILEFAYKSPAMLPKERAGIKLTLEVMDLDVSVPQLVKSIRGYLTDFGKGMRDVKYYPPASLIRELKEMSFAERTKYVDEITELKPGSKNFVRDFKELDRPAKRYVSKNITEGFWPLAIVSAIIVAGSISEAYAQNNFDAAAAQANLAEIGNKIEEGTASKAEKWLFFTDPYSDSFIETDPLYTLEFVNLVSEAYQAERVLNEAEEETTDIQQGIENTIISRYQQGIDFSQFGSLE